MGVGVGVGGIGQYDVGLLHNVEATTGQPLEEAEVREDDVLPLLNEARTRPSHRLGLRRVLRFRVIASALSASLVRVARPGGRLRSGRSDSR